MAENDEKEGSLSSNLIVRGTVAEAEFAAVVFHGVLDCYAPEHDIECCYTIKASVRPTKKDWVGLFKVGWQSSREHYTYEWSPYIEGYLQDGEDGKAIANRVVFKARYLPKADDEFYQFCYATSFGDIRGASVPFQIKTKNEDSEFECCEMEDEEGMLLVKHRTAILEESLGRALEENAALKASKERAEGSLENLNDMVLELENNKSQLTAQIIFLQKQSSALKKDIKAAEKDLEKTNQDLEEDGQRRLDLEITIANLETNKKDLMVLLENANKKIEELAALLEQEKVQSSVVQKTREKLVSEKLQFLQNIAANRELADKLTVDLKAREEEIKTLKVKMAGQRESYKKEKEASVGTLDKTLKRLESLEEDLKKEKEKGALMKESGEIEATKASERLQAISRIVESKEKEVISLNKKKESFTIRIACLQEEKAQVTEEATNEVAGCEHKIEILLEESIIKQELIHRLEDELEELKSQFEAEKGKNSALEEDYESVLRTLENQLDGERALNKSLCSQSDRTLAELQDQLQHQLEVNGQQGHQLEAKNVEVKELQEEIWNKKKQLQSFEERMKVAYAQLSAADEEVKAVKSERETLQKSLSDTKGLSLKSSKNSAASMYAFQTAHTHLEKKYFQAKKDLEELWRERNELKRCLATIQGNLPIGDLRLEIEDLRAKNEDLRVRLNMGAEAYKVKFIECRKLQSQMKKLQRTPSVESEVSVNCDVQSVVSKLRQALDEEKAAAALTRKALEMEKETGLRKTQEIEQINQELTQLKLTLETRESEEQQQAAAQSKETTTAELHECIEDLRSELDNRDARVADMEHLFKNEKSEKQNLIEEIVNLQEQLKTSEEEREIRSEEMLALQHALNQEEMERDRLGEMARQKISDLEGNGVKLREEVERWKKEVDMHVEAETKMIGGKEDPEVQPEPQPRPEEPPQGEQPPQDPRPQFQWPWHKNWGHGGWQQQAPPRAWGNPQPWILVQTPEDVPQPQQPNAPPQATPGAPPHIAPPRVRDSTPVDHCDRECPVCKILFPPNVNVEGIAEHVNGHFDGKSCQP